MQVGLANGKKNRGNHKKQSYIKNMYLEWIMYE